MVLKVRVLKAGVWALGLYPLARVAAWLIPDGVVGLGANPIEKVLHHTGWWALALLMAALAVTPARRLTGRNELVRIRRPLGLFAFFYASLHLAIYVGLDQFFAWGLLFEDVLERPFITVGFLAWLLLLPLAATSTRAWIRRLGRRWAYLHRLVYVAAALGIVHFYWRVRADTREPLVFAAAFLVLMGVRLWWLRRGRKHPDVKRPARTVGPAGRPSLPGREPASLVERSDHRHHEQSDRGDAGGQHGRGLGCNAQGIVALRHVCSNLSSIRQGSGSACRVRRTVRG